MTKGAEVSLHVARLGNADDQYPYDSLERQAKEKPMYASKYEALMDALLCEEHDERVERAMPSIVFDILVDYYPPADRATEGKINKDAMRKHGSKKHVQRGRVYRIDRMATQKAHGSQNHKHEQHNYLDDPRPDIPMMVVMDEYNDFVAWNDVIDAEYDDNDGDIYFYDVEDATRNLEYEIQEICRCFDNASTELPKLKSALKRTNTEAVTLSHGAFMYWYSLGIGCINNARETSETIAAQCSDMHCRKWLDSLYDLARSPVDYEKVIGFNAWLQKAEAEYAELIASL